MKKVFRGQRSNSQQIQMHVCSTGCIDIKAHWFIIIIETEKILVTIMKLLQKFHSLLLK